MILHELYRVLDEQQEIHVIQYDYENKEEFIVQCRPDNIPVYLLDASIKEVKHSEESIVVVLCN